MTENRIAVELREAFEHFRCSDCDSGFAELDAAIERAADMLDGLLATLERLVSDPDLDDAEAVRNLMAVRVDVGAAMADLSGCCRACRDRREGESLADVLAKVGR